MSEPLSLMIRALELEVAAIRKKGGTTEIELRGGEHVGRAEGAWLYRFLVTDEFHLRDDTPVRVTVGQDIVSGVLVSFREGVLLVALDTDLGPQIASARLVADDSFLVERLKDRLEAVQRNQILFSRAAADRVLGLVSPSTGDTDPHPAVTEDGKANADQLCAVRRSLGSDTTFVWGPPGTGKTHTLARIVEAHYRAGRSVLLVSNTNIAVDTALERVAERLKGETDFHQGLVIRHGPVMKEELRQRFGKQVILEEVVARLGETLKKQRRNLLRKVALIEAEERSLATALTDFERLVSARQVLATRQKAQDAARASIAARELEAEHHRARGAAARDDLERARAMGALLRFLRGLDVKRLEREAVAAEREAQAAADAARALAADLAKLPGEIDALQREVDQLALATRSYSSADEIRSRLDTTRTRLREIRERIAGIDRELADLSEQVLARCRILATTVYRTYIGNRAPRRFGTVVVDEASMLNPPLVFYAAGLAAQSVTVAGDFRQLPPIVMSDEPLAVEWLRHDVFEKADIPQRLQRQEPTPHLVQLRTQYRMREPICAVINELFYEDHPLRSDPSVNRACDSFPLGGAPLLYVDTAPFHPWAATRIGTFSRYNLLHALMARNIVLHLAETDFLPPFGNPNDAVGVITPYAAQARLIQALVHDRLGARAAGVAATVHRFQGNEKTAIVLDLTDSIGVPLGHFLKATRIEEDGARLLNVALSRARQHLVVLGNFEYLRAKAPRDGFVDRLLHHIEENGEALDPDMLLPLGESDWIDGLHRARPMVFDLPKGAAGAFTEGTFYPAFLTDLARARESILIVSPFATGGGTARWMDPLRAALARGVRVLILTLPPDEYLGNSAHEVVELVESLRSFGVTVALRARMHQKVAIVDGSILWHGSLNILSHRDTHELMQRLDDLHVCEIVGRLLGTPTVSREEDGALWLEDLENPACPRCGGPTIWTDGRLGINFQCEDPSCPGRVDLRRHRSKPRGGNECGGPGTQLRGKRHPRTTCNPQTRCPQPGCGGRLAVRNGRYGRFLGCTNYPRCRYTEDLE